MTMQCWGAQGADLPGWSGGRSATHDGGLGGYVTGNISSLSHYQMLYIYVGCQGKTLVNVSTVVRSFNGGGGFSNSSEPSTNIHAAGQGGGATDIRLTQHTLGTWGFYKDYENDEDKGVGDASFSSRLIVAAGGGGANQYATYGPTAYGESGGGDAGGLKGYPGLTAEHGGSTRIAGSHNATGGTQTGGGTGWRYNATLDNSENGSFGWGGTGNFGGGGGGYYGGGSGGNIGSLVGSGAGGSSYVSGHGGCSTLTYSGKTYTFTSPEIWDGLGYKWNNSAATSTRGFPNTAGSGTENGHTGNGYAKITLITPEND